MSDMETTSSLTKLASGKRVVSAKDDAASLAIGSRLNAEVVAMKTAKVNAGQAGSMLQIADGAMATISDILVRMKELAVQASSGQFSSTERSILDSEFQALKSEITRISQDTEFNGTQLIAGSATTVGNTLNSGTVTAYDLDSAIDGFTSFTFDNSVADGAFEVTFTAATNALTVTDLINGTVESKVIDATAIAAQAVGANTDIRFDTLGLTIALNNNFADADITTTASEAFDKSAGSGTRNIAAGGVTISAIDLLSTTGIADLGGAADVDLVIDTGTDGTDGTATIAVNGGGNNFTATGVDYSGTSATVTLTRDGVDADGNTVVDTLTLSITAVAGASGDDAENDTLSLFNFQNIAFASQTGDTAKSSFTFKVGTGNQTYDSLTFDVNAASASALNISGNDILTAAKAETASTAVSAAIDTLNTSRSEVGAAQNRLTFASANLSSAIENAEAARSTLLDLDVAAEMTAFTSKQVLMQTGIAMLAQANQIPQNLLRLFQ
jgi:flagellin